MIGDMTDLRVGMPRHRGCMHACVAAFHVLHAHTVPRLSVCLPELWVPWVRPATCSMGQERPIAPLLCDTHNLHTVQVLGVAGTETQQEAPRQSARCTAQQVCRDMSGQQDGRGRGPVNVSAIFTGHVLEGP